MGRAKSTSDASLIELFLDMLAAERGAAANTLAASGRVLDEFALHLREPRAGPRGLAAASTGDVRSYLQRLSERGLKATSSARRLSAIRQFYRFLCAEGRRRDDPAAVLQGPRRGRAVPKV